LVNDALGTIRQRARYSGGDVMRVVIGDELEPLRNVIVGTAVMIPLAVGAKLHVYLAANTLHPCAWVGLGEKPLQDLESHGGSPFASIVGP